LPKSRIRLLWRRVAEETGGALIVTLGMSLGLAIAGTSMLEYTTSNSHAANRSGADKSSSALADAGLNSALAVLANPANSPADQALLPARTTTYTTGSSTWSGTYDRANAVWTLNSTGSVRNPAAPAPVLRRASAQVRVTPVYTAPLPNNAWDFLYTTQTGVGTSCEVYVQTSVTVTSPLYVTGDLCLGVNATVAAGPLVVKGQVTNLVATASVGTAASPISEAHIGGGCKWYSPLPLHSVCSAADNVHVVSGRLDQVIPEITPPTPLWDTWYRYAAPGPFEPCTASTGAPPVFENQTVNPTRNNSVSPSFNLTPVVSYSCRVGPADAPIGELSWDAATRTLTVQGTVYIDGSAKVENGQVNRYAGQGTIYLSGTMYFSSGSKLCAKVAASGTECDFDGWNPRAPGESLLTIVANGNGNQPGVPLGDSIALGPSASFEGMLFATWIVELGVSSQLKAGVVAWTIFFRTSSRTYTFPALDTAPVGTPGAEHAYARMNPPQGFAN
jgi:hypothetical protein